MLLLRSRALCGWRLLLLRGCLLLKRCCGSLQCCGLQRGPRCLVENLVLSLCCLGDH